MEFTDEPGVFPCPLQELREVGRFGAPDALVVFPQKTRAPVRAWMR